MISRRTLLVSGLGLAASSGLSLAQTSTAAWKPGKPLRFVVAYAPGGGADNIARLLSKQIGSKLGQPIVVENRTGANGIIAANHVYDAAPNGETFLIANADFISVAPHVPSNRSAIKFDPNGYTSVAPLGDLGFALVTRRESSVNTIGEAFADLRTGKRSYGHWGTGSSSQLGFELLKAQGAFPQALGVPYPGAAPVVLALRSGDIDYAFVNLGQAQANRTTLKILAIGGPRRVAAFPEVPTLKEAGFDVNVNGWVGLLAPPRTAAPIVQAVRAAVEEVYADPATSGILQTMGFTSPSVTSARFQSFVEAENARIGKQVKLINVEHLG